MNLAIENLVKNNSVKNLIEFPFSLCIEKKAFENPIFITIQNLKSNLLINKFDLSKIPHIITSDIDIISYVTKESFNIHPEQLFDNGIIINEGYKSLKFINDPVENSYNSYNKPMNKKEYDRFYENALNPSCHKKFKKSWLWFIFVEKVYAMKNNIYSNDLRKLYSSNNNHTIKQKFIGYSNEVMAYCKINYYDYYQMYLTLEKFTFNSIKEKGPAGELIFLHREDL